MIRDCDDLSIEEWVAHGDVADIVELGRSNEEWLRVTAECDMSQVGAAAELELRRRQALDLLP